VPATTVLKNLILDIIYLGAGTRFVDTICLVEQTTGALKDCGSLSFSSCSGTSADLTATITPTASYVADKVRVCSGSCANANNVFFETPLPSPINTSGVSEIRLTWRVTTGHSVSASGAFTTVNAVRLDIRLLNTIVAVPSGAPCTAPALAKLDGFFYFEPAPSTKHLLYVQGTPDRTNKRVSHGITNFKYSGSLGELIIDTYFDIEQASAREGVPTDQYVEGIRKIGAIYLTRSPISVTTADAVSAVASFDVP
jgi:hypothetical protein